MTGFAIRTLMTVRKRGIVLQGLAKPGMDKIQDPELLSVLVTSFMCAKSAS